MWIKYGRARQATDDNIIWLMRWACWINKANIQIYTQNMHMYCIFTATVVTPTRPSVTLEVHCLSCYVMVVKYCHMLREKST